MWYIGLFQGLHLTYHLTYHVYQGSPLAAYLASCPPQTAWLYLTTPHHSTPPTHTHTHTPPHKPVTCRGRGGPHIKVVTPAYNVWRNRLWQVGVFQDSTKSLESTRAGSKWTVRGVRHEYFTSLCLPSPESSSGVGGGTQAGGGPHRGSVTSAGVHTEAVWPLRCFYS